MEVVAEEEKTDDVGCQGTQDRADKSDMKAIDFWEGHEVFCEDEDSKSNGFELEVALFFEHQQSEEHDDGGLKSGLPKPDEKVDYWKVFYVLERVVKLRIF